MVTSSVPPHRQVDYLRLARLAPELHFAYQLVDGTQGVIILHADNPGQLRENVDRLPPFTRAMLESMLRAALAVVVDPDPAGPTR